jgi:hypothetical protein
VKDTKFLRKLNRVSPNSRERIVVHDLGEAGQWKVFPQRMASKAVVGQNSSQIAVLRKMNPEQVSDFTL